MLNWFRSQKKMQKIEIRNLGEFIYDNQFWVGRMSVNDLTVEISLAGDTSGPNQFSANYLSAHFEKLSTYWELAISYSQLELKNIGVVKEVLHSQFVLKGILITEESSYDNGHLVFEFEICSDWDGSYYVSFVNEKPNVFHRDN